MKTEHVRMIADMETAHRTAVQFLQLQLFNLRRENNTDNILRKENAMKKAMPRGYNMKKQQISINAKVSSNTRNTNVNSNINVNTENLTNDEYDFYHHKKGFYFCGKVSDSALRYLHHLLLY